LRIAGPLGVSETACSREREKGHEENHTLHFESSPSRSGAAVFDEVKKILPVSALIFVNS
jgi:hypothetical protein